MYIVYKNGDNKFDSYTTNYSPNSSTKRRTFYMNYLIPNINWIYFFRPPSKTEGGLKFYYDIYAPIYSIKFFLISTTKDVKCTNLMR